MERLQGLIGLVALLAIAWALSDNRRRINWRIVGWGLLLQFAFAIVILRTPVGTPFFSTINLTVTRLLDYSGVGSAFLFRPVSDQLSTEVEVLEAAPAADAASATGEQPPAPKTTEATIAAEQASDPAAASQPDSAPLPAGTRLRLRPTDNRSIAAPLMNLAFLVLPTIIFFSGLLAVLYHLGIMQWIVRGIAWVMVRTMGTSGAETLCVAGNIFVGQTEAPLLVRPYLAQMTRSEMMAVMVGGFATIAGGVMALYVGMLQQAFADLQLQIAGHLLAASVMSAPAALAISKILVPEVDTPCTLDDLRAQPLSHAANLLEAFGEGVSQGLTLALNVAAMLLAFVAAMALINGLLGLIPVAPGAEAWSVQWILGMLFRPLAWTLGAPWGEADVLGMLMGEKLALTELVAYTHLCELGKADAVSPRTALIASYALCGFANFASIGVQLGGIGALAPQRKGELSQLALRAMVGGALASWMTAAIAGLLLPA